MKCPNCNATEHEPTAKFCHVCGAKHTVVLETSKKGGKSHEPDIHPNRTSRPEGVMAVDLGLPSGTRWASCNVGAMRPEEYGGYYAWGETKEKNEYSWDTYSYCDNGNGSTCHNLGYSICGTSYDAAHVYWAGNWKMPTEKQCLELIKNCQLDWTTLNGINGGLFTSKINGQSIFLPAAGVIDDNQVKFQNGSASYWAGTHEGYDVFYSEGFSFAGGDACTDYAERYVGRTIRPVISFPNQINKPQNGKGGRNGDKKHRMDSGTLNGVLIILIFFLAGFGLYYGLSHFGAYRSYEYVDRQSENDWENSRMDPDKYDYIHTGEPESELKTGSLFVDSSPQGAVIILDGKRTGLTTPATIDKITEGKHTVAVKHEGIKISNTWYNIGEDMYSILFKFEEPYIPIVNR